jgi:two-component system cell cycle sensor histidine kinase/response regulator CckA
MPRWVWIVGVSLPVLIIILIILGWFVALRYQETLVGTVIDSYQETQLEVVRAVARSIHPYIRDRIVQGISIETIEQQILRNFVEPIHLLQNGDAWIYAPDHVVFDLSSDFPEIYRGKSMADIFALQKEKGASHYDQMAEAISEAREGTGWYIWLPDKGTEIAAWTPVRFNNHVWIIGLSTPLKEIMQATGSERQKQLIRAVMALATLFGGCLSLTALWGLSRQRQLHRAIRRHNKELRALVADLESEVRQRSESEAAANALHERLNTLIEALPDVIHFKDLNGRNLVVNKAFEKMVGLDKTAIIGKRDEDLLPPNLVQACSDIEAKVRREKTATRFEVSHQLEGRKVFWDCFKAPLLDKDGELVGMVCVTRDITDYREAEKERLRLGEQLLHAQKMEAIGTLAGGVAHELNNILTGLITYPELLISGLPPDSPLKDPLRTIQSSGERAAGIVQDLLTMARRGAADKQILNLNTIISDYLESQAHRNQTQRHPHIRVNLQLDAELMNVRGSPGGLSKVVMKLVDNAFESFDSPGMITIATENCYIDARKIGTTDVSEGEYIHLSIADSGVGIDAENLPRIFEPFFTKKKLGRRGSGVGLAVAWGAVQDHRGAIDVRSTFGEGSVFDVYLPATREAPSHSRDRTAPDHLTAGGESILVVDDVYVQREIARKMLESLGYRVHLADSGEAAVAFLKKRSVDLVVLDMIMGGGMDGLDTYRAIIEMTPGQKAVIASGFAETDRIREAQRMGAGAYIKKPFLLETLARAIRDELEG